MTKTITEKIANIQIEFNGKFPHLYEIVKKKEGHIHNEKTFEVVMWFTKTLEKLLN